MVQSGGQTANVHVPSRILLVDLELLVLQDVQENSGIVPRYYSNGTGGSIPGTVLKKRYSRMDSCAVLDC